MKLDTKKITAAAEKGSEEVVKAFQKLSDAEIKTRAGNVSIVSLKDIKEEFTSHEDEAIISYARIIEGLDGVAIYTMTREHALMFIDLINKQEIGSSGILREFDRSAIKETLNILSNAYITSLANVFGQKIMVGPPYMITASRLLNILPDLSASEGDTGETVMLTTKLTVAGHNINAHLYLVFNPEFAKGLQQLTKE